MKLDFLAEIGSIDFELYRTGEISSVGGKPSGDGNAGTPSGSALDVEFRAAPSSSPVNEPEESSSSLSGLRRRATQRSTDTTPQSATTNADRTDATIARPATNIIFTSAKPVRGARRGRGTRRAIVSSQEISTSPSGTVLDPGNTQGQMTFQRGDSSSSRNQPRGTSIRSRVGTHGAAIIRPIPGSEQQTVHVRGRGDPGRRQAYEHNNIDASSQEAAWASFPSMLVSQDRPIVNMPSANTGRTRVYTEGPILDAGPYPALPPADIDESGGEDTDRLFFGEMVVDDEILIGNKDVINGMWGYWIDLPVIHSQPRRRQARVLLAEYGYFVRLDDVPIILQAIGHTFQRKNPIDEDITGPGQHKEPQIRHSQPGQPSRQSYTGRQRQRDHRGNEHASDSNRRREGQGRNIPRRTGGGHPSGRPRGHRGHQ